MAGMANRFHEVLDRFVNKVSLIPQTKQKLAIEDFKYNYL